MVVDDLKAENWGRYPILGGKYLRSNEYKGPDGDIIIHKNRATLDRYYHLFAQFRPRSVFEMGVKEGGSLVMWHELFQCQVAGIDTDVTQLSPEFLEYVRGRTIVVGHMEAEDIQRVQSFMGRVFWSTVDLIVDDCLHTIEQIPFNLELHWDALTRGGMYIIEDWYALDKKHREELVGEISDFLYGKTASATFFPEMIQIIKRLEE